jgi:ppGpp synthetase/RelA/SpoT-type nucleotidyltranferase
LSAETLLAEYERALPQLQVLARQLEARLELLLAERGVMVHFVSSRVKSAPSLARKLARPDKTYASLWDVTDLVGLRIATYFEDTIEEVARLIEHTFAVDFANSTDKHRFTDTGTFGYRSLHYVCALPGDPLGPALRFEIQVRTALQHAWAEVEHDLGYKADGVPAQIRRRFSRVASLLEIADQEFVALRRELSVYQATVSSQVAEAGGNVTLDEVSLGALVRTAELTALDEQVSRALGVPRLDEQVSRALGVPRGGELYFPTYLLKLLKLSGLNTTREVREALRRHGAQVPAMIDPYFEVSARLWRFGRDKVKQVEGGYGLFFLAHLAVLEGPELRLSRVARLTRLYEELDALDERTAQDIATALLNALGALRPQPG